MGRWRYSTAGHVLIVQDPQTQRGYPEKWLQETHPLAWGYLKKFEDLLRERAAFKKFFDPEKDPFYSMYAISDYTFARNKVVWMDVSATMKATVITSSSGNNMPLPEHKIMLVATRSTREAHYAAAVLNSRPFDTVVTGYIVDNSVSTHPIENIVIPRFDAKNKTHARLAALSGHAHAAAAQGNDEAIQKAEDAIDQTVAILW